LAIIGTGDMVYYCLEAAKKLKEARIECSVVDMHTIKPLDEDIVFNLASSTRGIITVEDHQIKNGQGSAVSDFVCESCPTFVKRIGLKNTFAESGEYELLLKKYEMDVNNIVEAAKNLL